MPSVPPFVEAVDRLHATVTSPPPAARLTLLSRALLAMAFLPTGLVKLLGERFTTLPLESPVGFFFEAMYRTGGYWRFLGATQLLAAVLLLVPQTAFWGAVLFVPIIVNIAVITTAVGFEGTPVVTWLMVLAALWLVAWDWPRWRGVLLTPPPRPVAHWSRLEAAGWGLGTLAGLALFAALRAGALGVRELPRWVLPAVLGVGAIGGLLVLAAWWRALQRSRRTPANTTRPIPGMSPRDRSTT